MKWQLLCGEHASTLRAAEEKGREFPDWYFKRPYLTDQMAQILNVYWDLSTCRSVGMSEGPIPWTAVTAYGQFHNLEKHAIINLDLIIGEIDQIYLKDAADKIKAARDKKA